MAYLCVHASRFDPDGSTHALTRTHACAQECAHTHIVTLFMHAFMGFCRLQQRRRQLPPCPRSAKRTDSVWKSSRPRRKLLLVLLLRCAFEALCGSQSVMGWCACLVDLVVKPASPCNSPRAAGLVASHHA